MSRNAPLEGSIRETLVIALPIVLSQACETAMVFTNRMFLSKLEPELMNAALAGGMTAFMLCSFLVGLAGFATALVAQYLGADQKEKCPLVITQAMILCLALYPVIVACRPLAYAIFGGMHLSPAQLGPQKVYFDILVWGSVLLLLRTCLSSFFSGIGRTRIVLVASCAAMLVNAAVNYVLIFGRWGCPALGIRGAAYGELLGNAVGLGILVAAYLTKANRQEFAILKSFRYSAEVIGKLIRYGSPTGGEMFSSLISFNAIILVFHSCGSVTATAATIMLNWDMVSFVPLIGFEIAVTSMVGRYMGARRPDSAHNAVISGMKLGQMYSAVIIVLFLFFPLMLVEIFRPTGANEVFAQAAPISVAMLRMASIYVLLTAAFLVFIAALRGAGDTFYAMTVAISAHWGMFVALALVLKVFHWGPLAGWGTIICVFVLFFVLVSKRYFDGKWRTLRMVELEHGAPSDERANAQGAL